MLSIHKPFVSDLLSFAKFPASIAQHGELQQNLLGCQLASFHFYQEHHLLLLDLLFFFDPVSFLLFGTHLLEIPA